MTETFIIGTIGSPHGLEGFVKVRSMSGETGHLLELNEVTIAKDGKERLLKIEGSVSAPPVVLMRFEGVDSPEKAKTLSGARLLAGREKAAPLAKGEFYIEDLKGLEVVTENGEVIGCITDIIEGGGGELAEIRISEQLTVNSEQLKKRENESKRLVPFRKEFFTKIDLEKGVIILDNLWILE